MMGHNHAVSGVAVALAVMPWAPVEGAISGVVWVLAVAGAALASDLDAVHSSASRMWGPVSTVISRPVAWLGRGHRWGTHDLVLAPASAAVLVHLAGSAAWACGLLLALMTGLAIRGAGLLGLRGLGPSLNLLVSVTVAWWLTNQDVLAAAHLRDLLGLALPLGIVAHILGDGLTEQGIPVPVLWLWSRRRVAVPLFSTGRLGEAWLATPALVVAVLLLMWLRVPLVHHWVSAGTSWLSHGYSSSS